MTNVSEPKWLSLLEVVVVHEKLLVLFGGADGIRDIGLLESALGRPRNHFLYERQVVSLPSLAALYTDGIVSNHPFVDGNKRTGFLAAALFLETNGCRFLASEVEAVTMTLGLAANRLSVEQYATWLDINTKK